MKITKTKLRQIIKEEIKLMLEYERYVYRRSATAAHPKGELWIKDDDGNDEPAPHLEYEYDHLEAGGQGETIFGTGDPGRHRDDEGGPGGSYGGAAFGDSRGTSGRRRRY
jgi:hypothetical protein